MRGSRFLTGALHRAFRVPRRRHLQRFRATPSVLRWKLANMLPRRHKLLFGDHPLVLLITSSESDRYSRGLKCREPEMLNWLGSFEPDDVLIDIGANIGTVSLPAGVNNPVVAVEPSWANFYVLQRNIRESRLQHNVTAICAAIGTRTEMTTLNIGSRNAAGSNNVIGAPVDSFLSKAHTEVLGPPPPEDSTRRILRARDHQQILSFSLDDFVRLVLARQRWHLKIDVDGLEAAIILSSTDAMNSSTLRSMMVRLDVDNPFYESACAHLQTNGLVLRDIYRKNHLFMR